MSSSASTILCYVMEGSGVAEKEVWDFGISKLEEKVKEFLKSELKLDLYTKLVDLFEIMLRLSLTEKYRGMLANSK